MSAIDKLKTLLQERHKFGDHQTLTAAIIELADRIEALEKPIGIPSDWCQNGCGTRTMDGLPLKECPLCSGAPKPEDIEAAKSEAMAQSNFERKMRNNAQPLGVPDEDDLVFAWRSLEIPRPSHDLSHAIAFLNSAREGWLRPGEISTPFDYALAILEVSQKAGAK